VYIPRAVGGFLAFAAFYWLMVLELGWLPANPSYVQADEGTQILVCSNGLHTDFIVPARSDAIDWQSFAPLPSTTTAGTDMPYAVIGWGDRGFYIDTPTSDEFSLTTALEAVFLPTESVMHVSYIRYKPPLGDKCVALTLTEDEFEDLARFLKAGFALDSQGKPIEIAGASYGPDDVFFQGVGAYHLFNTCNNWANQALQTTGITTPIWSPLEYAIFDHVKNR